MIQFLAGLILGFMLPLVIAAAAMANDEKTRR